MEVKRKEEIIFEVRLTLNELRSLVRELGQSYNEDADPLVDEIYSNLSKHLQECWR